MNTVLTKEQGEKLHKLALYRILAQKNIQTKYKRIEKGQKSGSNFKKACTHTKNPNPPQTLF